MTNTHIEQEHPDYTNKSRMWRRYRDLYAGGEQFRHIGQCRHIADRDRGSEDGAYGRE